MIKKLNYLKLFLFLLLAVLNFQQAIAGKKINESQLTVDEKIYGLSFFWKEVSYNFAHWKSAGELDWDKAYSEYIPKVIASKNDFEYYQLLLRFCALLKDGHTNIFLPKGLINNHLGRLPFKVKEIDRRAIIADTDISLKDVVPIGSGILEIDGKSVAKIAKEDVFPLISTSAPHMYWDQAYRSFTSVGAGILFGPKGSVATVKFRKPDGKVFSTTIARDYYDRKISWTQKNKKTPLSEFKMLEGQIAYMALNSFSDSQIVNQFREKLPEMAKARAVIIDLRKNGGGNSNNSSAIVGHFTDQPFTGSAWHSVIHDGVLKAWGKAADQYKSLEKYKDYYFGHKYQQRDPSLHEPSEGQKISVPTIVLIGHVTGSAAEDFLIMADKIEHIQYLGEPTFGSTGQPLMIDLPGGGSARISAKRDFYPDGREFIGLGVQPDILVKRTVEDFWKGRDAAFEMAVEKLK